MWGELASTSLIQTYALMLTLLQAMEYLPGLGYLQVVGDCQLMNLLGLCSLENFLFLYSSWWWEWLASKRSPTQITKKSNLKLSQFSRCWSGCNWLLYYVTTSPFLQDKEMTMTSTMPRNLTSYLRIKFDLFTMFL